MDNCVPPIWQYFATLQSRCNSTTLNSQAWGADEAIEAILDDMANGLFETNPPLMLRRFDSLQSNRSKKIQSALPNSSQKALFRKCRSWEAGAITCGRVSRNPSECSETNASGGLAASFSHRCRI